MNYYKIFFIMLMILGLYVIPIPSLALPEINIDGQSILPRAEIYTMPRTGNFSTGSTFDVPIYIDTKGNSINTINIKVSFDQTKLSIIKPSFGKSIFGIWLEPPTYSNELGTASFVGVIPNGIVTNSGLIATISFKAVKEGTAKVMINDYSSANLNDGLGSEVILNFKGSVLNLSQEIIPQVVVTPIIPNVPIEQVEVAPPEVPIEKIETIVPEEILPKASGNTIEDIYKKLKDSQVLRIFLLLFVILLILFLYKKIFSHLDKNNNIPN